MKNEVIKSNITNSNFKAIIFDLNGTIASRVSDHPEHIRYRNKYIEDKIKATVNKNIPDITSVALKIYDLDPREYYQYRNERINWNLFNTYSQSTFDALTQFYSWGYDLILYTDCYSVQIEKTLEILKIKDFFKLIISAEHGYKKPSKDAFNYISKELKVKPEELLMIANDWDNDLEPLHRLGGSTIWLKSEDHISDALEVIQEFHKDDIVPI